jgi:hypothetical protein
MLTIADYQRTMSDLPFTHDLGCSVSGDEIGMARRLCEKRLLLR